MKRYDSYKDSGVKWLGEIPNHWETRLLKYCCSLKGRIGWNGLKSDEFEYSSYAYLVTGQDFVGAFINWNNCYQINQKRYDEDPYIQLVNGDILITKDGSIGKVAKVAGLDKPACLNSGIFVIKQLSNLFDQSYLYWALNSSVLREFNRYTQTGATIAHLYQNVFEQMPCLIPPIKEQESIAKYLDSATSKIDEAIAQQQKMIDLLNERKQIIINNAVTKGLDPNVKMKPSGIDWIGDIPEHWEIRRMRYLCKITTGNKDTINRVDDGLYPFYVRSPKVERINSYSYDGEAVLMAGDGVGAGKVFHYVNGKFDYHQRVYCFYEIEMIKAKLLYYYMQNLFKYVIEQLSAKSTVDSVRLNMIQDFVVCIPSIKEQIEIVNFIDKEFANIEKAIQISLNQISLLQERKQIIINDVVTGKVKVI